VNGRQLSARKAKKAKAFAPEKPWQEINQSVLRELLRVAPLSS